MIHFIEQIVEPNVLFLAWQSLNEKHRTRYIVARLERSGENVSLTYLADTDDFHRAKEHGFEFYPAFKDIHKTHENVLDTFMRRLPPRSRGDFPEYLKNFRIKADAEFSDFALLGYTGAKLPTDSFSIIHPFINVSSECGLLIEAAGYRFAGGIPAEVGTPVSFVIIPKHDVTQEVAITIHNKESKTIGFVPRGLINTFVDWLSNKRSIGAWIEKVNGTSEKPRAYIFVKVSAAKET